jgi:hypothetical protein
VAARHLANHLNASETMLYWLIARPEGETEQSVYNSLLASVSSQPVRQTAAFTELKRALRARRIVQVIADDAGALSPRGIKAVETISDETGIGVTLITLPQGGVNALQGAAAFYEFSSLTIQQVQFEVLPNWRTRLALPLMPTRMTRTILSPNWCDTLVTASPAQ